MISEGVAGHLGGIFRPERKDKTKHGVRSRSDKNRCECSLIGLSKIKLGNKTEQYSIVPVISTRQIFFAGECFVFLGGIKITVIFILLPKTRICRKFFFVLSYTYDRHNTCAH